VNCHSSYINLRAKSLTNPDLMLAVDVLKMLLLSRCRSFRTFDLVDKDQIELKPMPQECFEVRFPFLFLYIHCELLHAFLLSVATSNYRNIYLQVFVRFVYEGYAALPRLQAVVQKMGITTLFQLLSISIEYGLKDLQYHCESELFKVTNTNNMYGFFLFVCFFLYVLVRFVLCCVVLFFATAALFLTHRWTIYQIATSCNSMQLKYLTLLTITKLFCQKEDEEEGKYDYSFRFIVSSHFLEATIRECEN
jgi:hypothetical protein